MIEANELRRLHVESHYELSLREFLQGQSAVDFGESLLINAPILIAFARVVNISNQSDRHVNLLS